MFFLYGFEVEILQVFRKEYYFVFKKCYRRNFNDSTNSTEIIQHSVTQC